MPKELLNRVANSTIKTINLENYFPQKKIVNFDLMDFLFKELILKEKDFRRSLKEHDWSLYEHKVVAVHCSTDAIIPVWAYMLVATKALPLAKEVFFGTSAQYIQSAMHKTILDLDLSSYADYRVVIKGCSEKPVPESAYLDMAARLQPIAQSIMYGEPCSTVPIFKRPRKLTLK